MVKKIKLKKPGKKKKVEEKEELKEEQLSIEDAKLEKKDEGHLAEEESDQDDERKEEEVHNFPLEKGFIYVELDEDISRTIEKIDRLNAREIYLVAASGSKVLRTAVNLRIVKRRLKKQGKKLQLITNDLAGLKIAYSLGIEIYIRPNQEGEPSLFAFNEEDKQLHITPLKATVNSLDEEGPTRMAEKKLSISEIVKRHKAAIGGAVISKTKGKKKKKKDKGFVMVTANRHALISLVVVSLFILLIIVYIALPGATIYLEPHANPIEKSVNISLLDANQNQAELSRRPEQTIASYRLQVEVSDTKEHFATGKRVSEFGGNAGGTITVYNESNQSWPLVANTRFQTEEGLVFRIANGLTVPAASGGEPGQISAFVTADPLDATGQIIGERGNIEASDFFLPGLNEENRETIYASSETPMTGGITDFVTFVSEEDLEASAQILEEELLAMASEKLLLDVEELNADAGEETFQLLEGDEAIRVLEVSISRPDELLDAETSSFEVSGSMIVEGVYYDYQAMLDILRTELLEEQSPGRELIDINERFSSYRIFEWEQAAGRIKLTANIKGIEQFILDPKTENGQKLLTKIKQHIAGTDVEQAEQYIQNLPEINKVEIKSWPVWSPTIPNILDNIEFEVSDAISVD